jgi:hypothetical protein
LGISGERVGQLKRGAERMLAGGEYSAAIGAAA